MKPEDLKTSMRRIYEELARRDIPLEVLSTDPSLIRYKWRDDWHFLHSTIGSKEPAFGYAVAENKTLTRVLAQLYSWPHPATLQIGQGDVNDFLSKHRQLVVKPLYGAHGHGITIGVDTVEKLDKALETAREFGDRVIVQQMVTGGDYRLLFIDGVFVAALRRIAASVIGDSQSTVRRLIEQENLNPERGLQSSKGLEQIPLLVAERYLGNAIDNIPATGEVVQVVGVPNLSSGGRAEHCTDEVSREMIRVGEEIVKVLGMGVCGVDFMWDGRGMPYLIEINANPGVNMHDNPLFGDPQGVVKKLVDYFLK